MKVLPFFAFVMDSHYVNEKRKQTANLETVVNQCPVLCSQHNRMKLVLERPWIALSNYTVVQKNDRPSSYSC